jgi:hypothetical protein
LYVLNNTFVNDLGSGTFVALAGGTAATLQNNLFVGPGTTVSGPATQISNLKTNTPHFVDIASFDYRPTSATPGIDRGTLPGPAAPFDPTPVWQYLHPASREPRPIDSAIDIGAYEYSAASRSVGELRP